MNLFVKYIEPILNFSRKIIPKPAFNFFQPIYHWLLAFLGAVIYGFPFYSFVRSDRASNLKVVGITGTSGKTTTVEFLYQIFSAAGYKTASLSGLSFRIENQFKPNMLKMTMPGRFKVQKFLSQAKKAGTEYVFLEITSEGIKQYRHKFIKFYAAIWTNLSPEHIESHGGFENYRKAKAKVFKAAPIHILNGEDPNFDFFAEIPAIKKVVYKVADYPEDLKLKISGEFNKANALAALAFSRFEGISDTVSKQALEKITGLPGRMEFIETNRGFKILVDYAFLPQSLEKVYKFVTFPRNTISGESRASDNFNSKLICVFGAAGGGRDKWKRPELAKVSEKYCREIILTNEDPYNENPLSILEEIERGFSLQTPNSKSQIPNKPQIPNHKSQISNPEFKKINYIKILNRRKAIREGLKKAKAGDTVVITGKGAEPWIMGPNNTKISWDDRKVVREELQKL